MGWFLHTVGRSFWFELCDSFDWYVVGEQYPIDLALAR
jgi:hypothetical protein